MFQIRQNYNYFKVASHEPPLEVSDVQFVFVVLWCNVSFISKNVMTCVLFVGSRVLAVCKENVRKQTWRSVIMHVNYRRVLPTCWKFLRHKKRETLWQKFFRRLMIMHKVLITCGVCKQLQWQQNIIVLQNRSRNISRWLYKPVMISPETIVDFTLPIQRGKDVDLRLFLNLTRK
jgi:hypothetical protein